jgi:hypothetical protein
MEINLDWDEAGRPVLVLAGRPLAVLGGWLPGAAPGDLAIGSWELRQGEDELGSYRSWIAVARLGEEPLLEITLVLREGALEYRARLLKEVRGLQRGDSFEELTFLVPTISFSAPVKFLAVTYGLGDSGTGYPGGYWPTLVAGDGLDDLPREAISPLVAIVPGAALAISPGSHFLTSALVKWEGGIARGLHGAVDHLPAGFTTVTVFAAGREATGALAGLGRFLRARAGTDLPTRDHPLLRKLGYWNAYGSYYTELLRPLTEGGLLELAAGFRRDGIPVSYFGLDLWYRFREIGKAVRYLPDPAKYPSGLAAIKEKTGLPYVLHLSALAEDNDYGVPGWDVEAYRKIAREIRDQGAIAAWHDWLRTQQHLYPKLRSDPEAAENWFSGMARAFSEEGLPVVLCMQTMGMVLASTGHGNVLAARSHTDYLFSQREALEEAVRRGHGELMEGWIPPAQLRRHNIAMGMVLDALGLAPFYDLFLSRPHPGLGGEGAGEEALLRALSCGPVGIGDGPGMWDRELIGQLILPDGTIGRPSRPLVPVLDTLGREIFVAWTETQLPTGDRWGYLLALNTAQEELPFRLDPPLEGDYLVWDPLREEAGEPAGRLPAGRLSHFLIAPLRAGIAPLGYAGKLVPVPEGALGIEPSERGWLLRPGFPGETLLFWSASEVQVTPRGGRLLGLERTGNLWRCRTDGSPCEIRRR